MGIPFGLLAPIFHRFSQRAYPDWARALVIRTLAPLGAGEEVVDLGGGTGALARMAHAARPELRYAVVDPAPGMLRYVPEYAERIRAKAEALPFPSGSVGAVLIGEALHHFRDPGRAMDEVARVLRPGGGLFVYEFDPTRGVGRAVRWVERFLGEPANFFAPGALVAALERRGFAVQVHAPDWRYVVWGTKGRGAPAS